MIIKNCVLFFFSVPVSFFVHLACNTRLLVKEFVGSSDIYIKCCNERDLDGLTQKKDRIQLCQKLNNNLLIIIE